jgi:hypothetical protein
MWARTPPQHQNGIVSPSRGTPAGFSINPGDIALLANQGQHFEVTDPNGKFVPVHWSLSGASCSESTCGTIDDNGNYLAPEELTHEVDVVLEAILASDLKHTLFTRIQLKPDPDSVSRPMARVRSTEIVQSALQRGNTDVHPEIQRSAPPNSIPAGGAAAVSSPKPGLVVTYRDDKLKIDAENTTLAAVLHAIAQKTGAVINVPAGAGLEPIVEHSGLARPDDVLTQLLTGSPFNFIIVNSPGKPSQLAEVILSMRSEGTNSVNAAAIPQTVPVPPATDAGTEEAAAPVPGVPASALSSATQEHLSPDAIEQMMKDKAQQIRAMSQAQAAQDSAQTNSQPSEPPTPQQQ